MKRKAQEQRSKRKRGGPRQDGMLRLLAMRSETITHLTRLVEQEGRAELAYGLAIDLSNRGNHLRGMSRPAEAIADHDKSLAILTRRRAALTWSTCLPLA